MKKKANCPVDLKCTQHPRNESQHPASLNSHHPRPLWSRFLLLSRQRSANASPSSQMQMTGRTI